MSTKSPLISDAFIDKIKSLNSLISKIEEKNESNRYSFAAMKDHIEEIKSLFLKQDNHWAAETVDLLIHCLLLLDRNGYSKERIDEIINLRCDKFRQKISNKLK